MLSAPRLAAPRLTQLRGMLSGGEAGDAGRADSRRIAGNAGLQVAARVLQVVSGIITLPLLARMLGPQGFGVWVAGLGYVGLFMAFTELGLTNAATLKMAAEPEHEREWLAALSSLRTVVAIALTAICVATIPIFLSDEGHLRLVALLLSGGILLAGAAALMVVFTSRLRSGVPLVIGLVQTTLWLAVVVVLSVLETGPVTLAVCWLAMMSVVALLQVLAARRLAAFSSAGGRERWRPLLRIALPLAVGGVLATVYYKVDSVLVFQLAGPTESGIYGAAYRFLDTLNFFPAAVIAALMPVFAATYESDPARTRLLVQRGLEAMVALGAPVVVGSLVLAPKIVALLFGPEYARAADVLPILMGSFLAICVGTLGGYLAPVVGLRWEIAAVAAGCVVVNVGLNVLLIPAHGALGAAWVTTVTEAVSALLLLGLSLRAMRFLPAAGRVLRALVAAALMGAILLAVRPIGLVPAFAAAALSYPAAVLALGVVRLDELRALRG